MIDYSTKSDEELSALKQAADEEMVELRGAKRSMADDAKRAGIAATLKSLRQVKLNIQVEQDKRLKPIPENPDHILGISGAATQSAMGNIGGPPEEPPVRKKKARK